MGLQDKFRTKKESIDASSFLPVNSKLHSMSPVVGNVTTSVLDKKSPLPTVFFTQLKWIVGKCDIWPFQAWTLNWQHVCCCCVSSAASGQVFHFCSWSWLHSQKGVQWDERGPGRDEDRASKHEVHVWKIPGEKSIYRILWMWRDSFIQAEYFGDGLLVHLFVENEKTSSLIHETLLLSTKISHFKHACRCLIWPCEGKANKWMWIFCLPLSSLWGLIFYLHKKQQMFKDLLQRVRKVWWKPRHKHSGQSLFSQKHIHQCQILNNIHLHIACLSEYERGLLLFFCNLHLQAKVHLLEIENFVLKANNDDLEARVTELEQEMVEVKEKRSLHKDVEEPPKLFQRK